MLNLREIEEAIKELEMGSTTYNNCMKLASLYIIRDEMKKQGHTMYSYGRYYPMMYERENHNDNPYMYTNDPMYHSDDDLLIKKDMYRKN